MDVAAHRLLSPGGSLYELLRRSQRSYLSWDQFLAQRLPSETSPIETWDLLSMARRCFGIDLTIPDLEDNDYWYLRTHEITDLVTRLQCSCKADSALSRTLGAAPNRRVLVKSRIDETIAAAQLDGLAISEEEAYDLLQLERTPKNSTEQLVANTLTAMDQLDDLVDRPFTLDLFRHLQELLLVNVDTKELRLAKPRMGLLTFDYPAEKIARFADRQAEHIRAYANHDTGDPYDHPILRALLIQDVFRFYRPLDALNSQVGRLVFRLYALKHDLPILGILPISRTKLDWEIGAIAPTSITTDAKTFYAFEEHRATDLTGYFTLVTQMAAYTLQELIDNLARIEERDEALREMLQRDQYINHRQRSILGRALRNPGAEFRIAYHKTTHNIVYATARADLLQLVEKGYLEVHKRDRAMVFTPVAGLNELLERQHPAASSAKDRQA
jgi:Fic family protein